MSCTYSQTSSKDYIYLGGRLVATEAPTPITPIINAGGLSPSSTTQGSTITLIITGQNLSGTTAVTFAPSTGITVSGITSTATQVTATVAINATAALGSYGVTVTTPNGTSNSGNFTITSSAPAINAGGLSPSSATQGSTITLTITGQNLSGTTAVNFIPATGITVSGITSTATQVTATVAINATAAPGSYGVTVTTPNGNSNSVNFTVNSPAPIINAGGLSPSSATQGNTITLTITGQNLSGTTAVTFAPSTGITVSGITSTATQVTTTVAVATSAALGSYSVTVTTPAGISNAATFTILTGLAAPSGLATLATGSAHVTVSWTNNNTNVDGTRIERSTNNDLFTTVSSVDPTTSTYTDFGLTAATNYQYRVIAYKGTAFSNNSNVSGASTVAVSSLPPAPSNLIITTLSTVQIGLSWTANGSTADYFILERKTGAVGTYSTLANILAPATTYSDQTVLNGTTYFYRVKAYNGLGASAYSNEVSATASGSYSLSLNGVDAYVSVPNSTSLNLTGPLTVEAWIKTSSTAAEQTVLDRDSPFSADGGYGLRIYNGKARFYVFTNGKFYTYIESVALVNDALWHHLAGVFDGSQMLIYIDGHLSNSVASTRVPGSSSQPVKIGNATDDFAQTIRFAGLVDEIRISSGAIYSSDFTPLHHINLLGSTVALWNFDGQNANDSSANGNNGLLNGGVLFPSDTP